MKKIIFILFSLSTLLCSLYLINCGNRDEEWICTMFNKGFFSEGFGKLNKIAFSPDDHILVAGDNGIFFSFDKGSSWDYVKSENMPTTIKDILVNSKGHIFAAHNDGVYRSITNGSSWELFNKGITSGFIRKNSGLIESHSVNCLTFNSNEDLIAGAGDGIFLSSDNGISWRKVYPDSIINAESYVWDESTQTYISRRYPNIHTFSKDSDGNLYASVIDQIYISKNNGYSWFFFDQIPLLATINWMVFGHHGYIIVGTKSWGVLRLLSDNKWYHTDFHWTTYSSATNKNGKIFIGSNNGIYCSYNNGKNWSYFGLDGRISSIAIDNAEILYATSERKNFLKINVGYICKYIGL